jgi:hypothetical protein
MNPTAITAAPDVPVAVALARLAQEGWRKAYEREPVKT